MQSPPPSCQEIIAKEGREGCPEVPSSPNPGSKQDRPQLDRASQGFVESGLTNLRVPDDHLARQIRETIPAWERHV